MKLRVLHVLLKKFNAHHRHFNSRYYALYPKVQKKTFMPKKTSLLETKNYCKCHRKYDTL